MKRFFVLGMVVFLTGPAQALDLQCMNYRPLYNERSLHRPAVPECLTGGPAFADAAEHNLCLMALQQFQRDVQDYLHCLESERVEAMGEFDAVLGVFRGRVAPTQR